MTVITADAAAEARIHVGWVVNSTVRVIFRRSLDLLLIGLPFVFLPNALAGLLPQNMWQVRLAAGLPGLVFVGGVSLLTYRDLSGGARLGAGAAIAAGARRFGTLWGVSFVSNICAALALLLLIVPGIILLVAWSPASTIAVVEDRTAFSALDRAWALTKGSRWRIAALLGLSLLAIVFLLLVGGVVDLILTTTLGADAMNAEVNFVISPLTGLLTSAMTAVGSAAVYVGLRVAKEGSAGDIAKVFE
jgi:hypothetical protein